MTNIQEIWKDVPGYEGIYQVSSLGRVKSLQRRVTTPQGSMIVYEKIRKFSVTFGYNIVTLSKDGINTTYRVHRLVALAFLPNLENKPYVNHIDGNKQNNSLDNLEWCTHSENETHAKVNGLKASGERIKQSKLTKEDALYIKENYQPRKNVGKLALMFRISPSHVWKVAVTDIWEKTKLI